MFVLDKVTDFLLLLGKLVVVGAVGVLSFYFFSGEWMGEIIKESSYHHFRLSYVASLDPIHLLFIPTHQPRNLNITFPRENAREESLVNSRWETNTESKYSIPK